MNDETPVTDADLHAYVDGQLTLERRRQVERYLTEHPEARAEVDAYRRLGAALHTHYDAVLLEPWSEGLKRGARGPCLRPFRAAAVLAWLGLGAALGWVLHSYWIVRDAGSLGVELVKPAAFAHYVYATDLERPVEIAAPDVGQLSTWLAKRLHAPLQAPMLEQQGYQLIGGRLLPGTNRMAAQFMYHDAAGRRITLYVRRGGWREKDLVFRHAQRDGVGVLYWLHGEFGYALSGELDEARLTTLAQVIHGQLRAADERRI